MMRGINLVHPLQHGSQAIVEEILLSACRQSATPFLVLPTLSLTVKDDGLRLD